MKPIGLFTTLVTLGLCSQLAYAQSIVPAADGTLTIVTPSGERFDITGGQLSQDGKNLFHSFQQFNLDPNQIANFLSNPNIVNILSRVTGGSASVINGLIQVSGGNSNLFLMNPAGIIFGSGAALNVPADFTATTATGIGFGGGVFNAVGANNYQSLIGNPTSFVFGSSSPGAIINTGNLTVNSGQALTLMAGTVINTGTLKAPGGNITVATIPGSSRVRVSQEGQILQLEINVPQDQLGNPLPFTAADIPTLLTKTSTNINATPGGVTIANSPTVYPTTPGSAIISGQVDSSNNGASALGGEITITGNTVSLVSANIDASGTIGGGKVLIGGDYQGKGNLPNSQNTSVSADSQINANAVSSGNGGRVIVWSDNTTDFRGTINAKGGLTSGDGGFAEVSGKQNLFFNGNVDLTPTNGNLGTLLLDPENITIVDGSGGGIPTNDSQLPVITAGNSPGANFTISQLALESLSSTANVILEANNNITINKLTNNILFFAPGPGGSIRFTADADSNGQGSFSMNTGDTIIAIGRDVSISGASLTIGSIDTSIFPSTTANGGAINLTATNGTINVAGRLSSYSTNGNGGAINLAATGNITTGNITTGTFSNSGNGGNITLTAGGDINTTTGQLSSSSSSGNGGAITLTAGGNINTTAGSLYSGSYLGNSGAITLNAGGNITTGDLSSDGNGGNILLSAGGSIDTTAGSLYSGSYLGNSGAITLNAGGNITTGSLLSYSYNGNGGNISLSAGGSIDTTAGSLSSKSDSSGNGGAITLNAGSNITTGSLSSDSKNGNGGNISLTAGGNIDTTAGELGSGLYSGNSGAITLNASGNIITGYLSSSSSNGNSGAITLNAGSDITTTSYLSSSSYNGNGGNILLSAGGSIDTTAGSLYSDSYLGNGGAITLNASGNIITGYLSSSSSNGNSGAITLNAGSDITTTSYLSSSSYNGNGGAITLNAGGDITTTSDLSSYSYNGNGGNILLSAGGSIDTTAGLVYSYTSSGNGGAITLNAGSNITTGDLSSYSTNGNGGNISLTAGGNIDTTAGQLKSYSSSGNGGAITLKASGNITTGNLLSYSNGNGKGGDVNLTAGGYIDTTVGQGYTISNPVDPNLQVAAIVSGSQQGDGGNVNLTAQGNIKTGFIGSGSLDNGYGGNIVLESKGGNIDATVTVELEGEQATLGGLVSASLYGYGGNVTITAPGDIKTGIIATGTIGPQIGGDVTITSTGGSIDTSAGANITAPSVSLLTQLGVPANIANAASDLKVGLGIFTFSYAGNGGDVTITAPGNITTSNIISGSVTDQGGDITITSKNGSIDGSSAIFIQGKGVTEQFLTSLGLDANIAAIAQAITQRQFGGYVSLSVFGDAGKISLTANGDIQTNYLVSSSFGGQGGDIKIKSTTGSITSGPIMLNAATLVPAELLNSSLSQPLLEGITNEELINLLTQGGINSSGVNGGDVTIEAKGDITLSSVNAQGLQGTGGNVLISTDGLVRITSTFTDLSGLEASVSTMGASGGGSITIKHGGNGQIPFIIGDPSKNGAAGRLTSGKFSINSGSFLFTEIRGNVAIISVSPIELNFIPTQPPALPQTAAISSVITINTLEQAKEILTYIQEQTAEIPALIYVGFAPPGVTTALLTDEEFARRESLLTSQYTNALSLNKTSPSVLSVIPEDDYELELILVTKDGKPSRIQLPGVTRKQVLEMANNFYVEVSNVGSNYKPSASQLYQWLLKPLEEQLKEKKISNILFFMPTGLRVIPVAALYDADNQQFVIQKDYTVGLAPSLNLVDYRYRSLKNAPVLAFGADNFSPSQDQNPLPAVSVELPLITGQIRSGRYFINDQFTLANVQRERRITSYPIVHLATHADFNKDNTQESYIQLYNEKLRLDQWQQLDLKNPTVDLLVISACRTAVGNSNIELGFGGLAVQAGVKTAIASLWYVGDTGTLALMDQLYRNLNTAPIKAIALQEAQRSMLNKTVYQQGNQLVTPQGNIDLPPAKQGEETEQVDLSHPYYWSSFTLIGSPW